MASGLERSWPGSDPLAMTMVAQQTAGRFVLHCRLENVSDNPIRLDRSGLPWHQPIYFRGTVVTADGKTSPMMAGVLAYLRASPVLFDLAPHQAIEGDFEPKSLPGNPMTYAVTPRDQDTLLLWTYHFHFTDAASSSRDDLVGVTFLPQAVMSMIPGQ